VPISFCVSAREDETGGGEIVTSFPRTQAIQRLGSTAHIEELHVYDTPGATAHDKLVDKGEATEAVKEKYHRTAEQKKKQV